MVYDGPWGARVFAHWPQNHRGNEEAWSLKTVHSDAAMLLMIIAQVAVATSVILSEVVTSGYIDSTRS